MFIIRSCLGWLFDQTNVPNEYYSYQSTRKQLKALRISANTMPANDIDWSDLHEILVPNDIVSTFFEGKHQIFFGPLDTNTNKITGLLEKISILMKMCWVIYSSRHELSRTIHKSRNMMHSKEFCNRLVILADFRALITPQQNTNKLFLAMATNVILHRIFVSHCQMQKHYTLRSQTMTIHS